MVKSLDGKYRTNTLLVKARGEPERAIQDYQGLHFLDLTIAAPQAQTTLVSNAGVDGQLQQGPVIFGSRTAIANFYLETNDEIDFEGKCHSLWNQFFKRDSMRIRQSNDIGICFYGIPKPFEITHISYLDKTFSIEFDIPSAYRHSVVRSSDFPIDLNTAEDLISPNMNLPFDQLNYTNLTGDFKIFNPSDFAIQPYEQRHEINITISGGTGKPVLTNTNTGEVFNYQKNLSDTDILILQGVHPLLNGNPCEIDTNHGSIDLIKRWNQFSLTGYTGSVSFDFPFIYN